MQGNGTKIVSIPYRYATNPGHDYGVIPGCEFQFLIGTLQTKFHKPVIFALQNVSIPYRYATNNEV